MVTIKEIDDTSARVKRYFSKYLSRKFSCDIIIDDETARVIALKTLYRNKDGGMVCLKGSQINLGELAIKLQVQLPTNSEQSY